MNLLQAIILGIVQGLTEFIPISSTAHLVFASRFTNLYDGDPEMITATIAVIQLGTLAAVLLYFAPDIWSISAAFVRDHWNWRLTAGACGFQDQMAVDPSFYLKMRGLVGL